MSWPSIRCVPQTVRAMSRYNEALLAAHRLDESLGFQRPKPPELVEAEERVNARYREWCAAARADDADGLAPFNNF